MHGRDAIVRLKKGNFKDLQSMSECPTPLNSFVKIAISLSGERQGLMCFKAFNVAVQTASPAALLRLCQGMFPAFCAPIGATKWHLRICRFLSDSLPSSTNIFSTVNLFCFLFQFLMACMSHVSVCFHARYVCLVPLTEWNALKCKIWADHGRHTQALTLRS